MGAVNPENKFPLQVGATWNQEVKASNNRGGSRSIYVKASIVALENVKVPAGNFTPIESRGISKRDVTSRARVVKSRAVIWYAPAFKKYVRKEIQYIPTGVSVIKR